VRTRRIGGPTAFLVVAMLAAPAAGLIGAPRRAQSTTAAQTEAWRKQAPASDSPRSFKLPTAKASKLPNGLTLLLLEDHRAPVVSIDVGIPIGDTSDPPDCQGLAEATSHLLTQGAGAMNGREVARQVELLGGRIASAAVADYSEVAASVLSENVDRMLEIVGDVVLRPSFPEDEIALFKGNRIQELTVQRQDPSFLVSENFDKILYGKHPYAASAPAENCIAALDRTRIENFFKSNYGPAGSVVIVAGDFDPARIESRAITVFSPWKSRAADSLKLPAPPERTVRKIYLVDRPGSEQADIRIGNVTINHSSPDYIGLRLANTILGSGTSSRLFLNLREQKGYTYDVSSSVDSFKLYGAFFGATETRTEVAELAIKELLAECDRIRNEKVSDEDLRSAKNYLIGSFSITLSTQSGLAELMLQSYMLGLPGDYLERYRERVEAVTAAQLQQIVRRCILTDRIAIVVVGDADKLRKQLEAIGPVELLAGLGKNAK
jgi:zinc protease